MTLRNPIITKFEARRNWQPHLYDFNNTSGILLNAGPPQFFLAAGQAPVYDYPNPRAPLRAIILGTIAQTTSPGEFPLPPNVQLVWPVPPGPRQPSDIRNFLETGNVSPPVLPATTFPPFIQYDWPVPPGPRQGVIDLKSSLDSGNNFPPFGYPLNQYDWPVPKGPIPGISLKTNISVSNTTPPYIYPFNQFDWPVPKGAIPGISLKSWINISETLPPFLPPFFQTDWPVPKGPVGVIDLKTWINISETQPPFPQPFFQTDWPVPPGPRQGVIDLKTEALLLDLPIVTIPTPFIYDYPNPRAAVPSISLRTHADSYKLPLLNQDSFFNGAGRGPVYDYPNPRGPTQPVITVRTWIDPTKLLLLGQDVVYGVPGKGVPLYDWPVPPGPRQPSDIRTIIFKMPIFGIPEYAKTTITAATSHTVILQRPLFMK